MHPARYVVLLLTTAALLVGACGGDDDEDATTSSSSTTPEEDPEEETESIDPAGVDSDRGDYERALTNELAEPASVDDIDLEGASAACTAAALIDLVGVDRLNAGGITPEQFAVADSFAELDIDLDDREVRRLGEALDVCIDFRQLLSSTAPDGYACLVDTLDESSFSQSLAVEWATGTSFDLTMLMFESAEPACAEQVFLATGVAQGDITQEHADCVATVLDDEVSYRILIASATPEGPAEADGLFLEDAFSECGVQR